MVMRPCLMAVARAVCNNLELQQERRMRRGEGGKENEGFAECFISIIESDIECVIECVI